MILKGKGQNWALVAAAGSGSRMGLGFNKQYAILEGMPILRHTLLVFSTHPEIDGVIVVVAAGEETEFKEKIKLSSSVPIKLVIGGATRQESVFRGLLALEREIPKEEQAQSLVLIHDGARPRISAHLIDKLLAGAVKYKAVAPALTPNDTIKVVSEEGVVRSTPPRDSLRLVQTPQVFSVPLIIKAHLAAKEAGFVGTDDCQLVERLGESVHLLLGDPENIKITVPVDLQLAQLLGGGRRMRIGHGYDVHRLVPGRPLILGGVRIPHPVGLLGHSDADLLLHAIADALLGALKLGDLGEHFPDTDPAYRGANSLELLEKVSQLVAAKNYSVINIDATVALEAPKLAPYIAQMEENIASCLKIESESVSVKATTQEGLGFVGRREGIAAWAVVLLEGRD